MRRFLFAFVVLGLLAQDISAEDAASRVVIRAARLIDGKTDRPVSPAVILIENDKIVQVGSRVSVPADAKVIDLGGATILPGLIDVHDHLTFVPENMCYKGLGMSAPRQHRYVPSSGY